MQYITVVIEYLHDCWLCYQDFKDTFVCNTQLYSNVEILSADCVIRISMNNLSAKVQKTYEICKFIRIYFVIFVATNLKDIHNKEYSVV